MQNAIKAVGASLSLSLSFSLSLSLAPVGFPGHFIYKVGAKDRVQLSRHRLHQLGTLPT